MTSSNSFVRIVSLPVELQTVQDVMYFLEVTLDIGKFTNVNIINLKTNGTSYRSAIAEVVELNGRQSPVSDYYVSRLLHNGQFGLVVDTLYSENEHGHICSCQTNFHFENGKPMKHLKLVLQQPTKQVQQAVDKNPPVVVALSLPENAWSSIYIPNIFGKFRDENVLKELICSDLMIGKVSRVDYVVKNVNNNEVCSAYVHFENWYDNSMTKRFRSVIDTEGQFKYFGKETNPIDVKNRYIMFRINHKPIPTVDSSLNIHQLAAKTDFLDKETTYFKKLVCDMQKELYYLRSEYAKISDHALPWVHAMERRLSLEESEMWKINSKSIVCEDESVEYVEYFVPSV